MGLHDEDVNGVSLCRRWRNKESPEIIENIIMDKDTNREQQNGHMLPAKGKHIAVLLLGFPRSLYSIAFKPIIYYVRQGFLP